MSINFIMHLMFKRNHLRKKFIGVFKTFFSKTTAFYKKMLDINKCSISLSFFDSNVPISEKYYQYCTFNQQLYCFLTF